MKRIVFLLALLTVLTVISFAGTSKDDSNYQEKTGGHSHNHHKAKASSHHIIHPVDHFTI